MSDTVKLPLGELTEFIDEIVGMMDFGSDTIKDDVADWLLILYHKGHHAAVNEAIDKLQKMRL